VTHINVSLCLASPQLAKAEVGSWKTGEHIALPRHIGQMTAGSLCRWSEMTKKKTNEKNLHESSVMDLVEEKKKQINLNPGNFATLT